MGCMESRANVQIPWALSSLSRHEWLQWRKCFLTFMDQKYIPPYKQINKFFKYTGFLGEEISDKLYFRESKNETNLKTLLFKFDVYFMFGGVTRQNNQSVEEYILLLKYVAEEAGNNTNIENVIKEKILQDFKSNNTYQQIKNRLLIPYITDYESLALHELIFLWNECEKPVQMQQYLLHLENRRHTSQYIQAKTNCSYCGRHHEKMKCYAAGQKCWNCGEFNHYAKCCSKIYITDCSNCGSNHAQNRCPAFARKCSRCKEMNHFSWKCFREIIQSCIFCGKSHINSRQKCTANNKRCSNCHRMGHFTNMCLSHRNRRYI